MRSFDELVDEAAAVPIEGWDFSVARRSRDRAAPVVGLPAAPRRETRRGRRPRLDVQTGGGEVLAGAGAENFPPTLVATEGWLPNLAKATTLLHPLGAVVVADDVEPPLPFADGAFDLVTSRHPVTVHWSEIARVLTPGGTYFAQHVGSGTNVEISEYFLGPLDPGERRHHEVEAEQAREVGPGDRAMPERTPSAGVLRRRRNDLLLAQGRLDGAGLHRRPVSNPTAASSMTRSLRTVCSVRR